MKKSFPRTFPAYVRKRISEGINQLIDANRDKLTLYGLGEGEAKALLLGLIAAESFNLLYEEIQKKGRA